MADPHGLTPLEIASGFVLGTSRDAPTLPVTGDTASVAFERAVLGALLQPPCAVGFSGGRDSSAVLAVAVAVARREGLPLPVPVTLTFPESPASDESTWQERVIRYLNLQEWQRIEIVDELDCVGPYAQAQLLRQGVYWPANAHALAALAETVPGGALLTGDGGDLALLTPDWADRLLALRRRQAKPTRQDVLRLGFALSPAPLRRLALRRRRRPQPVNCPWLRPRALRAVEDEILRHNAEEPLRLDRRLAWAWRLRPVQVSTATLERIATDAGVKLVQPFQTPQFGAALAKAARAGRRFADRTEAMRWLFSDVLPDDVCARPTKGGFKDVFWNRHSRAFAESWEGEGADRDLVDVDALRTLWRSPEAREHFRSCTQLQASWLARHAGGNGSAEGSEEPVRRATD